MQTNSLALCHLTEQASLGTRFSCPVYSSSLHVFKWVGLDFGCHVQWICHVPDFPCQSLASRWHGRSQPFELLLVKTWRKTELSNLKPGFKKTDSFSNWNHLTSGFKRMCWAHSAVHIAFLLAKQSIHLVSECLWFILTSVFAPEHIPGPPG